MVKTVAARRSELQEIACLFSVNRWVAGSSPARGATIKIDL